MILSLDHLHSVEAPKWHISDSSFAQQPALATTPWSKELVESVIALSQFILSSSKAKQFPEIIALGFWFRAANLRAIDQQRDVNKVVSEDKKCAGKVFHIAPANVDTVFFYSMLLSVLGGNQNIVRISSRSGEVTHLLLELLNTFLGAHPNSILHHLVSVLEYPPEQQEATKALTQWCDLRVIWGGDNAIHAIQKSAPHNNDQVFPDRYSIALLKIIEQDDIDAIAAALVNDLTPFGQQACSSPKALFWWQTDLSLQQAFYQRLAQQLAKSKQQFELADKVEQIVSMQRVVMITDCDVQGEISLSGLRILALTNIDPTQLEQHNGHGLLLASQLLALENLPFADKLQSLCHFGLSESELASFKNDIKYGNLKRAVALGKALEFSHIWDGVNLCEIFSK